MRNPVLPRAGTLAARVKICLLLLPSGPDKIHSMTPHETQPFPYGTKVIIPHPAAFCKPRRKFPFDFPAIAHSSHAWYNKKQTTEAIL